MFLIHGPEIERVSLLSRSLKTLSLL